MKKDSWDAEGHMKRAIKYEKDLGIKPYPVDEQPVWWHKKSNKGFSLIRRSVWIINGFNIIFIIYKTYEVISKWGTIGAGF